MVSQERRIISWNRRFLEIWGISEEIMASRSEELALQSVLDKLEEPEEFVAGIQSLTEQPEEKLHDEIRLKHGRTLERYTAPLIGKKNINYGRIWYFRDISERKNNESRLLRQNRVLSVLSAINSLIVRVQDQDELFREACKIAVDAGQLRMAWIGTVPAGETTLMPLAWAGHEAGYLEAVAAEIPNMEECTADSSATMEALRIMQPVVRNNLAEDPDTVTLKHEALARGYQAIAIFPLDTGNNDRTVMGLYAAEKGFFDEEEMRLLTELAGNISYAMRNLLKQDEIDYLSFYDPQTGLLNRNSFQVNLESMLEKAGADNSMLTLA
ncbi:MAG: GAF domain-containing protein, partial [Balneolaceae bacterium]